MLIMFVLWPFGLTVLLTTCNDLCMIYVEKISHKSISINNILSNGFVVFFVALNAIKQMGKKLRQTIKIERKPCMIFKWARQFYC